MAPKFEFNLIKVEINQNTYACSHESGVTPPAQPTAPSKTGWRAWAPRILKVAVLCIRLCLAIHGADPDPVGLAVLGYGFITELTLWLKDRFKK